MKIRFLLDENLSPRLRVGLLRYDPLVDVLRVGDVAAPAAPTCSGTLNVPSGCSSPMIDPAFRTTRPITWLPVAITGASWSFGLARGSPGL